MTVDRHDSDWRIDLRHEVNRQIISRRYSYALNIRRRITFALERFHAACYRQRRKFRRRIAYAVVDKRVLRLVAQAQIIIVHRDYPQERISDCVACLVRRADLLIGRVEESRVRHFVSNVVNRERLARF